jgi:hypothetical protein
VLKLKNAQAARAAAFALLTAACGAPETPLPSGALTVTLGTGEAAYESIEGEPQLPLVAGVQGGQHVWASFLAYGFDSSAVAMLLTTSVDDAPESRLSMRANLTTRQVVDDQGELAYTFAGFPAQVYGAPCAHGKRVRIDLTLSDANGDVAEDTRYCIANVEESRRSQSCP